MDYAGSYEEYRRWRGELRCHYLMLIPFVNEKNVMRLYDRIFHRADRTKSKEKERKDSLVPLLLPSGLGICLCLICLCSMTWAWYSASVDVPAQKLTAAYYEVSVKSVVPAGGTASDGLSRADDGSYNLIGDTDYTITLQASGSVKDCGGYCLIECGDTVYYTQTFKPGYEIIITLKAGDFGPYTFTGVWGSLPLAAVEKGIIKADVEKLVDDTPDSPDEVHEDDPAPVADGPSEHGGAPSQGDMLPEPEPASPQEPAPAEGDPEQAEAADPVP